jgi:C-terminal processing protease CtpA/Prc
MAAKLSQRGYMGLEFDKATDGQYVVKKVIESAPAARAGFQPGDVILVVNGARWSDERAMNKLNWGIGSKMSILVQRAGEKKTLNLTLGRMPEEVMAQYIGAHMLENHVTVAVADGAHDR